MSVSPAPRPYAPQSRMPHWPVLRKKQVLVVPILAIVVGAIVMATLIGLTLVNAPTLGMVAVLLSATTSIVGIVLLVFLDRWEPEPPHLLAAAFVWGGGVAVLLALIATPLLAVIGGGGDFFTAVISAPLIEESAKGLFLVVVLLATKRGRAEFNSLTDALVYAGFVGIGFSFVEDMFYIAGEPSLGSALAVAGVRIGLGAWSHSIYTAMFAIGLWLAISGRGPMRFVWPFVGWAVAVLLHAIHNASTMLGIGAYFTSLLLFSLPALIVYLVLAVRSYQQEGRTVAGQLPVMVYNGWISPEQANWLGNQRSRRLALAHADFQGRLERLRVATFRDNVTELAYVRDRLDRNGPPYPPELVAHHDELVGLLTANRQWIGEHLQPPPSNWRQVGGHPGREYTVPAPPGPFG